MDTSWPPKLVADAAEHEFIAAHLHVVPPLITAPNWSLLALKRARSTPPLAARRWYIIFMILWDGLIATFEVEKAGNNFVFQLFGQIFVENRWFGGGCSQNMGLKSSYTIETGRYLTLAANGYIWGGLGSRWLGSPVRGVVLFTHMDKWKQIFCFLLNYSFASHFTCREYNHPIWRPSNPVTG